MGFDHDQRGLRFTAIGALIGLVLYFVLRLFKALVRSTP